MASQKLGGLPHPFQCSTCKILSEFRLGYPISQWIQYRESLSIQGFDATFPPPVSCCGPVPVGILTMSESPRLGRRFGIGTKKSKTRVKFCEQDKCNDSEYLFQNGNFMFQQTQRHF